MDDILRENVMGRIACHDGHKSYIVPINYAYDGTSIIAHSAEGMKIEMMRKNPHVCFEVDQMKSFTEWESVIAWGEFHELTDEDEQLDAMEFYVDRMSHLYVSETALPHKMLERKVTNHSTGQIKTVIFRIAITEKTGRFENE